MKKNRYQAENLNFYIFIVQANKSRKVKRCISSWCYKSGVDKSFFLEWANNVKAKIDERMSHLTNKLHTNKHMDYLLSPDVKNALDNIHKDFVVVSIDKATGNIALVYQRFYAYYYQRIGIEQ